MTFVPTIGLEIHAELKTRTKMFCDSPNDPDEKRPNLNVCPICMGHPGTLPVINREAVRKVIRVGLALSGEIAPFTLFERKNYFYPDLPKGYQISQYQLPLVRGGYLDIEVSAESLGTQTRNPKSARPRQAEGEAGEIRNPEGKPSASYGAGKPPARLRLGEVQAGGQIPNPKPQTRRVRIQRVHLEEDTGRLIHDAETGTTLVDFNRAGIPLMELVTEPDMRDAGEARLFAEEFQRILHYLQVSRANMEKGEMRIEVNVSLAPADSPTLGTKVELKNINSFKFVERAIRYEVERQRSVLEAGGTVRQETRGWDEKSGKTLSQRTKEESHDYRYFPEPDLPPLKISSEEIPELRAALPELPAAKRERFIGEFGLPPKLAEAIVAARDVAAFFEATVSELREWLDATGQAPGDPRAMRLAANYLTTDVARLLSGSGQAISETPLDAENFAELITYLAEGKISSRVAKDVLAEMYSTGADPSTLIQERGLWQAGAAEPLASAVEAAIAEYPQAAADYRSGKVGALQFLVGQVMKRAGGANPEAVRKLLEEKLKS